MTIRLILLLMILTEITIEKACKIILLKNDYYL